MPAAAAGHAHGSRQVLDLTTTITDRFGNAQHAGSRFGATGNTTKTRTGKPFGTFVFDCVVGGRNAAPGISVQCLQTLATPHGQITLQGTTQFTLEGTAPQSFQEAITGGTGVYKKARGYAQFTVVPERSARVVLHLST
ncbi:hypothetical protein [Streptomyces sp. NPDC048191]|uniref:hypothetical protein n=1 Tax=Streptomyces sp. NPDC048191 TaxID=3155484 RepID=UPI0033F440AB